MLLNERQKRKKRRLLGKCHFGEDDMVILDYIVNPVHFVPECHTPDAEYDYYLDTRDDIYLLRMVNSDMERILLCKHDSVQYDFICIIAETRLSSDLRRDLERVVARLKTIRIPRKIYLEQEYSLTEG